jgi:hypothetical protein
MKLTISILILLTPLCSFAGDKCVKRSTIESMYPSNVKYITNYGHLLAIKTDTYDNELGYEMDAYALRNVAVKDKKTNKFSHYKKCLVLVKSNIQGKYQYGSFGRTGFEIKQNGKITRVSLKAK